MATQPNPFDGFEAGGNATPPRNTGGDSADADLLRQLPNETIYFYQKTIDNSGVVRQDDPKARARCWRRVALTTAGTLVLAAFLWPNVYSILAGYRIESLKQDQARLIAQRASLEVQEARLLSPERLQELAPNLEFLDPGPGQVVYLNPKPDGSLAWNQESK